VSVFDTVHRLYACDSLVTKLVFALKLRYYFVDGHSLNDRPRLAKVVVEELSSLLQDSPPTESEILKFLNGNQGRKEIKKALVALEQMGVHGIPKFIIEGRTMVDGAARSDTFVEIFRKIEKLGTVFAGPIFGDILGIPTEIVEKGSHMPRNMVA
jgi:hypothetical protein